VKIRPEAYRDVDDDVWKRVEVFREVLRERERADRTLTERARDLLGMATRFSDIEEIRAEVFGDVALPRSVERHVDEAAALVENGDEAEASAYLLEQFGSVCDAEHPREHPVGDGVRYSLCHRHDGAHEEPASVYRHLDVTAD
jgi:peptide/nickel transport system ATP-binding protein